MPVMQAYGSGFAGMEPKNPEDASGTVQEPENQVSHHSDSAGKKPRGFAAMSRERQREIASMGGRAAHQKGTAHEFTTDEAREAGRKGGEMVSADRQHMAEIGRKGGASHDHRRLQLI